MIGKESRYNMKLTFNWGIETEDENGETKVNAIEVVVVTNSL